MKKIVIPTVLSLALCSLSFPLQAYAADVNMEETAMVSETDIARATGLISVGNLSISKGSNLIYVTMKTKGYYTMSQIGFTNIQIQKSLNEVDWTTETNVSDKILSNSDEHCFENFPLAVQGGYYYRVVLNHYAKNYSGTIQTEYHVSNSVRVP